ncbi:chemotaxis protein CheA, partial [Pseudomonas sp. CrR25]|nr:chemotaxis protein CheA [Pseudomonas sp. CrR25]
MNDGMEQFLQVFFEEAEEHLANLEHLLLTLDTQAPDPEALNGIFRAAHSIKGSSGMFGFDDLTAVTHVLETLLEKLRSGRMALQTEMIDVFLASRDVLSQLLAAHQNQRPDPDIPVTATVSRLQHLIDRAPALAATATPAAAQEEAFGFFDDAPGLASAPAQAEAFGFFDEAPGLAAPAATEAYGLFDEPGAQCAAEGAVPVIDTPPSAAAAPPPSELPADERRTGDRRSAERRTGSTDNESSSIRVSVEKIDSLINQVGELVITQAMLAQLTVDLDPSLFEHIHQALSQLEHNTRDLQESVMSIRMLPISFIFNRFPRLVRDTAGKLGKKVELHLQGEHTELDKGVIEKLTDPLTHIIRNSVDHGIESPEERLAAGKSEHGSVRLAAYHQGGRIVVEIADDGRGLARSKLLAKARQQGLAVSDEMPDSDVWQLIFMPGFSTAEVVTDLSGRGVGMDVVRRNIAAIGGRIDIESLEGVGTRIAIRLPLTLAILDGMIVSVQDVHYVIPLTYIIESLQPKPEDIRGLSGQRGTVIRVRGEYLPLLSLHDLLNRHCNAPPPATEAIVLILEAEGQKFALQVDYLVGQQQVVIKSLEQ